MNDEDVSRQIQQMVRFILQEADEKANEISISAEEEFNIEKLQLVEAEKRKIKQEYEKKEKQVEIRKKIEYSMQLNASRIKVLQAQDDLVNSMKETAAKELLQVSHHHHSYKDLLKELIVQSLLRLKEPSVLLRCREDDHHLVESILHSAKHEYAEKANVHYPEIISKMKLTVKILKGTHFDIHVQPSETVMAVKKNIEAIQGKNQYPCGQQLLIHSGKVLKDETTLEENKVSEAGFLVVMLSKSKTSATTGASSGTQNKIQTTTGTSSSPQPAGTAVAPLAPPASAEAPLQTPIPAYDQAASNTASEKNLEAMVQQLMDMGGGSWDRDTVQRALRAAYNNPEHAVDYLYSGIPTTGAAPAQEPNLTGTATVGTSVAGLPNSAPLNLFPQVTPSLGAGVGDGSLDFLRNSQQFQALRTMVQANPQILQPMLQELSKQNPQLLSVIQDHHAEFLQLINEPVEDLEGDLFDQPDQEMTHAVSVTPAEQEALDRLEAMGFDRERVIEAFLACDRNEQLAANYLLEHAGDED